MKKFICFLILLFNIDIISSSEINVITNYKEIYNNDDIVGKIVINGTSINEIVVQGKDNEYYLNHDIYKKENIEGSVFLDYRTSINSNQINIYGHNSELYDVPFKELSNYLDYSFYINHKYIEIYDGYINHKYIIFSINLTKDNEHLKLDKSINHLDKLKRSIYNANIDVDVNDNVLVIQTCNTKQNGTYIIISAKEV